MIWVIPLVVLFWCLGGQLNKLWRPIGVMLSLLLGGIIGHNHPCYCLLPSLLYGFELTLGYGPNSLLFKWFKEEQQVRMIYGNLLALPVIFTAVLTMNWWAILCYPLIVAVTMIRLGSWGKIGNYDILPVDIFRGLAVGVSMAIALK